MADSLLVNEQSSVLYGTTLKDQAGTPVAAGLVSTLTLTLYDRATGTVLNGRNAQSVKNDNGGVLGATSGLFQMTFEPADSTIVTATEPEEHHVGLFEATWSGGGLKWEIDLWVRNLALTPASWPDLSSYALLTLEQGREALKLTTAEHNALVASLINEATDRWESETGRRLKSRTYTGLRVGTKTATDPWLPAPEWPVTTLTAVTVAGTAQTLWVPGALTDPADAEVRLLEQGERRWLYRSGGWGTGVDHIALTMIAGYGVSAAPLPGDLVRGVKTTVQELYYKQDRQTAAVATRATGAESVTFYNQPLPIEVLPVMRAYRRWGI